MKKYKIGVAISFLYTFNYSFTFIMQILLYGLRNKLKKRKIWVFFLPSN